MVYCAINSTIRTADHLTWDDAVYISGKLICGTHLMNIKERLTSGLHAFAQLGRRAVIFLTSGY